MQPGTDSPGVQEGKPPEAHRSSSPAAETAGPGVSGTGRPGPWGTCIGGPGKYPQTTDEPTTLW